VPAAAVIPAPIAYIKVVAVKKLVVGFLADATGLPRKGLVLSRRLLSLGRAALALICRGRDSHRLL
jgi:hypothetical protein